MTPEELHTIGKRLYGWGWQTKLASEIAYHRTTVERWRRGKLPIPEHAAKHIRLLANAYEITPTTREQQ